VRAAVLLCAAPPRGIPLASAALVVRQLKHLPSMVRSRPLVGARADHDHLTFNRVPPAERAAFFDRLVPESGRVARELSLGAVAVDPGAGALPAPLGERGRGPVRPPGGGSRIAARYGAEHRVFAATPTSSSPSPGGRGRPTRSSGGSPRRCRRDRARDAAPRRAGARSPRSARTWRRSRRATAGSPRRPTATGGATLARAALACLFWLVAGLGCMMWSFHTTDEGYGRAAFYLGLGLGNGGDRLHPARGLAARASAAATGSAGRATGAVARRMKKPIAASAQSSPPPMSSEPQRRPGAQQHVERVEERRRRHARRLRRVRGGAARDEAAQRRGEHRPRGERGEGDQRRAQRHPAAHPTTIAITISATISTTIVSSSASARAACASSFSMP
jgi:hypothetical protein